MWYMLPDMDYNSDKKRWVWSDLHESYVWQDEYDMNYMIWMSFMLEKMNLICSTWLIRWIWTWYACHD